MTDLLPDTDVLVALHRERVEPDVGCVDPHIGQLEGNVIFVGMLIGQIDFLNI